MDETPVLVNSVLYLSRLRKQTEGCRNHTVTSATNIAMFKYHGHDREQCSLHFEERVTRVSLLYKLDGEFDPGSG